MNQQPDYEQINRVWQTVREQVNREREARERAFREAWPKMVEALRPAIEHVKRCMNVTQDDFTLAPPQDPRERALWAKDHRNTGPDRSQYKHRGIK